MSCLSQDLGNLDLRKAIDNFIEAPIKEIIEKLEGTGVVDKVGFMVGDVKVICGADQRVLGGGAQEDVGRGSCLVQEDRRCCSQDQKSLEIISNWESTRMDRKTQKFIKVKLQRGNSILLNKEINEYLIQN